MTGMAGAPSSAAWDKVSRSFRVSHWVLALSSTGAWSASAPGAKTGISWLSPGVGSVFTTGPSAETGAWTKAAGSVSTRGGSAKPKVSGTVTSSKTGPASTVGDLHLRRRFGGRFLCLHRLRRRQGGLGPTGPAPASGRPLWPPARPGGPPFPPLSSHWFSSGRHAGGPVPFCAWAPSPHAPSAQSPWAHALSRSALWAWQVPCSRSPEGLSPAVDALRARCPVPPDRGSWPAFFFFFRFMAAEEVSKKACFFFFFSASFRSSSWRPASQNGQYL